MMVDELAKKREERRRAASRKAERLCREEAIEMAALYLEEYNRFREEAVLQVCAEIADRYPDPELRLAVAETLVEHEINQQFEGEAG